MWLMPVFVHTFYHCSMTFENYQTLTIDTKAIFKYLQGRLNCSNGIILLFYSNYLNMFKSNRILYCTCEFNLYDNYLLIKVFKCYILKFYQ